MAKSVIIIPATKNRYTADPIGSKRKRKVAVMLVKIRSEPFSQIFEPTLLVNLNPRIGGIFCKISGCSSKD